MIDFFIFLLSVVFYLVIAGATHGYAKHRWPKQIVKRRDAYYREYDADKNEPNRGFATVFWPFYWTFVWPFTKINEVTFSHIEKKAAVQIGKNKVRIADIHATRAELEKSNSELEQAEIELENEMAKMS